MQKITNIQDLFKATQVAFGQFYPQQQSGERQGGTLWYRGQTKDWPLLPASLRPDVIDFQLNTPDDWFRAFQREQNFMNIFLREARGRYPNCPRSEARAEWLCLMRHHGLPTRLLDWSVNILTAAFFAVRDHNTSNPPPGVILALAPALLNKHFFGEEKIFPTDQPPLADLPSQRGLLEIVFPSVSIAQLRPDDGGMKTTIAAFLPPEIDPKMMQQQSAFTLHGKPFPLVNPSKHPEFLMKFTIPGAAKDKLAKELHAVGIRLSMLFPDLTSLATCITERVMNGSI